MSSCVDFGELIAELLPDGSLVECNGVPFDAFVGLVFSLLFKNYRCLEVKAMDFIVAIDTGSMSIFIDGECSDL